MTGDIQDEDKLIERTDERKSEKDRIKTIGQRWGRKLEKEEE